MLEEELTFDMSSLRQLKRMALTRMGTCQLLLPPQACQLYICSRQYTWPQPAAAITSLRLVMEVFILPYTDDAADMLRELPALVGLRELEIAIIFIDWTSELHLEPALLAQLTKLTSLRVYPTWRTSEGGPGVPPSQWNTVTLMVPAALKLRTLHIVAPTVRLGFQNALASAAALKDFKVTAAAFESLHGDEMDGFACMHDMVGPHLAPGLSVRTCAIEGEPGQESTCVWVNELEGEMLQDYLLDDPCQCHAWLELLAEGRNGACRCTALMRARLTVSIAARCQL